MYALIDPTQGNLVVDVQINEFPVAPPLVWVDAPDGAVVQGHTLTNGVLTAVAEPTTQVLVQMSCLPLQFINKFTPAEQLAVVTTTMSNPQVKLFYDKMLAASEIVFNDAELSAGMSALVSLGIITQARMDAILPPAVRTSNVVVL